MKCIHVLPYTPLLYSKTGVHVCRGIFIFLIFGPKHRLCVLTIYDLSKNKKNIKFSIFTVKHLTVYYMGVFSSCNLIIMLFWKSMETDYFIIEAALY